MSKRGLGLRQSPDCHFCFMAIAAKCSLMPISFFDIENNHALRRRLYVLGVGKVKDGGSCPTYLVTIARLREAFIEASECRKCYCHVNSISLIMSFIDVGTSVVLCLHFITEKRDTLRGGYEVTRCQTCWGQKWIFQDCETYFHIRIKTD